MLKLISDQSAVLNVDDFYIVEKTSGLDELIFNMSIYDPNYPHVLEESVIEYEQPYLVKAIDAGPDTAKIKCQLNLDALKATMTVGYTNNSATLAATVNAIIPAGWTFVDNSGSTISRTIEGNYTPLEIIQACAETYGVVFRFDVANKIITAYTLSNFEPLGAFASRELNLTEINFKGKSTDFFTRLYAYGKDGLSFADINGGLPYVDYTEYSGKIICAYWQDDRYTVKENLLTAAQAAVKEGGTPQRSYECTVYDLAATNPEMYSWQDFSLFSVIRLIDDIKNISVNYQVVEYWRYPYYPEKNLVTLSTTAPKIQNTVKNIQYQIENPNSAFQQGLQNLLNNLGNSIAGFDGGNLLITQNEQGQPNGLMIMDTADKATAQKILYLNLEGIAYSSNGADGPFDAVWSFAENGFVANWIVVGSLTADIIKGGTLTLGGVSNGNGVCQVLDANGNVVVELNNSGAQIYQGAISVDAGSASYQALSIAYNLGVPGTGNQKTLNYVDTLGFTTRYYGQLGDGTTGVFQTSIGGGNVNVRTLGGTIDNPDYSQGYGIFSLSTIGMNEAQMFLKGKLQISGDLSVSGQKNRIVDTESYGKRLMYAYETATPYFGDIGTAEILPDGYCFVEIDPIFAETVSLQDYVVFIQPEGPGECYIAEKYPDCFIVAGTPEMKFAYEIKAKQKGFEKVRLDKYQRKEE